jgi:hypothetical protein
MSDDCFCLAPQRPKPSSASSCELVSSESRTSSLNVPALESSLLPPSCLVSSVPLGSQLPTVSPPSTGLPSITNTTYDLSRPSLADLPPTRPLTNFLPSSQSTVGAETESLKEFFTAVLGSPDEKRVQRLVRVVQGFCKAKELPDGLYERLWPEWSRIFRSPPEVGFEAGSKFETEVAYRLRRLMQARQNIRKGDWEVSRLWLVFLAHEVEHISRWESIDLYTSRGIDPMSAAIKIAKKYFDTADVNYKRSRNIVQLLKEGGPASLLEDGDTPPST